MTRARQLANLADRFNRTRETLGQLQTQLIAVDSVNAELLALRPSRDKIVAPDKKTLKKIKKSARARDDAQLKLDAALITIHVTPDRELQIDIVTAEEPGQKTLAANLTQAIKGAPEVAFRIEGVGDFRATGPTGSVDDLRAELETSLTQLQDLTAGFGTDDVDRLESLHAQATELDQQIERADVKLTTLLGGHAPDDLRANRVRSGNAFDEIVAAQPTWREHAPDAEQVARAADDIERQFTTDIDRTESANDQAQEALNRAIQKQSSHNADIKAAETQIASIETRLKSLAADGVDDTQRNAQLTEMAMQRDAAQGRAGQVAEKLKAFGDDPAKTLVVLERQVAAIRETALQTDRKLNSEKGRLEQITSEAPIRLWPPSRKRSTAFVTRSRDSN